MSMKRRNVVNRVIAMSTFIGLLVGCGEYPMPAPPSPTIPTREIPTTEIKVIAFDVFGTVFDLTSVDRGEIRDYVRHVKASEWEPLELPKSWATIPAHPDAFQGLLRLRSGGYTVVTLSNGPMRLLTQMSRRNHIEWDAIVPIELRKVYKPDIEAYRVLPELFGVKPNEIMMVTANPTFGDVEAAKSLGWHVAVIRQEEGPKTIEDLADSLLREE